MITFKSPKIYQRYFDVIWLVILQKVFWSSSGMFLKVFWLTLFRTAGPSGIFGTFRNFQNLPILTKYYILWSNMILCGTTQFLTHKKSQSRAGRTKVWRAHDISLIIIKEIVFQFESWLNLKFQIKEYIFLKSRTFWQNNYYLMNPVRNRQVIMHSPYLIIVVVVTIFNHVLTKF